MSRLRRGWLPWAMFAVSFCALGLAGCATTGSWARTEPVLTTNSVELPPDYPIELSNTEAEFVIARAIAAHEMRHP